MHLVKTTMVDKGSTEMRVLKERLALIAVKLHLLNGLFGFIEIGVDFVTCD